MNSIPVNIISGFLGSGKTTAIINLLRQKTTDEQWAVIINEFGKISIDSQTLRSITSDTGTVFDISGGCICCSARGYFQENLEKIINNGNYSRILIEPSGLGGIEMVSEIVEASPNLTLMPVICMLDITLTDNPRLQNLPIYRKQIEKADIIVFTKCDLPEDSAIVDALIDKFKSLHPEKQNFLVKSDESLLLSLLDPENITDKFRLKYRIISAINDELTDKGYHQEHLQYEEKIIFDLELLTLLFTSSQHHIIRAKGHVRTPDGWKLFNYTLSGCSCEPCEAKKQNELILISGPAPSGLNGSMKERVEKTMISRF